MKKWVPYFEIVTGVTLLSAAFLLFSESVHAAVLINEISWMGSAASASDEWIELRNTSDTAVDLAGYTIGSGNGSIHTTLSGSIGGSGYFLLERTDDGSVPNVSADQIYSGSLTNSGDTLTLKNASGSIIDTVRGGENWANIGGDNETKDTAQRTDSGWITAPGTPRRANASSGTAPTPPPSPAANTSTTGTASTAKAASALPVDPEMTVSAGGDKTVLIGTDVSFAATAYGKEKKPVPNATYLWTFGDGTSKEGTHVVHEYSIPGDYAVMVNVGNIDSKTMVTDRIVVHAREPSFALSADKDGSLTLMNNGGDDIDIGGFILREGEKQFTLPLHTIILGDGFIRFLPSLLGFSASGGAELLYPSGVVALKAESTPKPASNQLPLGMVSGKIGDLPSSTQLSSKNTDQLPPATISGKIISKKMETENQTVSSEEAAAAQSVHQASPGNSSILLWLLLLVALLGSAIAAVILIRREPMQALLTADDFSIMEETDPLV